jgi:hypothetical protein
MFRVWPSRLTSASAARDRVPRFSPLERTKADSVRFLRLNMARPSHPPEEAGSCDDATALLQNGVYSHCIMGIWAILRPSSDYRVMGSDMAPETSMRPGNAPDLPGTRPKGLGYQAAAVPFREHLARAGNAPPSGTELRHPIAVLCSREIQKKRNFIFQGFERGERSSASHHGEQPETLDPEAL